MFGNDKSRKNGLNIIVVGGGKVGATLVERLSRENHDVTLIDKNRVKLDAITGAYDVMGVEGNGASFAVQKEAGIAPRSAKRLRQALFFLPLSGNFRIGANRAR